MLCHRVGSRSHFESTAQKKSCPGLLWHGQIQNLRPVITPPLAWRAGCCMAHRFRVAHPYSTNPSKTEVARSNGSSNRWQLIPVVSDGVLQSKVYDISGDGLLIGPAKFESSLEELELTNLSTGDLTLLDGQQIVGPGQTFKLAEGDEVELGGIAYRVVSAGKGVDDFSESTDLIADQRRGVASNSVTGGRPRKALVKDYGHWLLALGLMYVSNRLLAKATAAAGIAFPSPLIGMFVIIGVLLGVSSVSAPAADSISGFFGPALDWIQRWLPLFYVPPLVVLPLSLQGIPGTTRMMGFIAVMEGKPAGSALAKIVAVIVVGMPASLLVTAFVAKSIRQLTNTELEPLEPQPPARPFTRSHHLAWGAVAITSLVASAVGPAEWARVLVVPFLLASTVEGLLLGSALPKSVSKFLHPLITCAVFANAAAAAFAAAAGWGYRDTLRLYLTKGADGLALGGGDHLMSFLGVVILSFGFRIFGQKRLMMRHAPEIFGSTSLSAAFSLFATAAGARAIGLSPEIARALAPRSVTVALALPIAAQLGAPASITAAGVALTGLLGSNCVQLLLNALGYQDPITRGLATAGASHGLGTAALAGKEPEALPFCALAYALIGIISTVLAAVPVVRSVLLAITA